MGDAPKKKNKYGSRRQVWNGSAVKTTGGLRKQDLKLNDYGRLVSKLVSDNSKKAGRFNHPKMLEQKFVKGGGKVGSKPKKKSTRGRKKKK